MDTSLDSDATQGAGDKDLHVSVATLEIDGVRPAVGDHVDVKVGGTIRKLVDDTAFVTPETINDQPMPQDQSTSDEDLMAQARTRLKQEIIRLGGNYAHVLHESVDSRHDGATGESWLHGRFTYMLYHQPAIA